VADDHEGVGAVSPPVANAEGQIFRPIRTVNAFGQLVDPEFALPLIGAWPPYEWVTDVFAVGGFIGIVVLMVIRQLRRPRRSDGDGGRRSRFYGSTFWQAYYVELTILGVTICIPPP